MAKEPVAPKEPKPRSEAELLAERLFIANWRPANLGMKLEGFSAVCHQAARAFCQTTAQISEGRSIEDILNPPDNVSVTE